MTAAKNMCTYRARDIAPIPSAERPTVMLLLTTLTTHIISNCNTRRAYCDDTYPTSYHNFKHSKQHNMCAALTYPASISQQSCAWTITDINFILTISQYTHISISYLLFYSIQRYQ